MKRKTVDLSTWILLALVAALAATAALRDPALPLRGLESSARLLGGVWLDLLLGFILAGLVDVLVPAAVLARTLGHERLWRGILIGWAAGLALPGGPAVFFPVAAGLFQAGAAPGPVIALLTAKTLVSPIRMLTYEAPLLGWPLTLARLLPGILVPPVLAILGQWIYGWLSEK